MKELISYVTNYMNNMTNVCIVTIIIVTILLGCSILLFFKRQMIKTGKTHFVCVFLLAFVISNIFGATLLGRSVMQNAVWKWQPFWSYLIAIKENDKMLLVQIIWNILLFVPVGFLFPICFSFLKKSCHVFGIVFVMAFTIEFIQGFTRLGWFEIDDIINNLLGTAMGVGMYETCKKIRRKRKRKRNY